MGGVYSPKLSLWQFIGLHSKFMGDVEGDGLSQGVMRSTRNGFFGPRANVDGSGRASLSTMPKVAAGYR